MRSDLLPYYEKELSSVRQLGAEFAQKYPKVASRLLLEPNKCEDPHVEREVGPVVRQRVDHALEVVGERHGAEAYPACHGPCLESKA